MPLKIFIYEPQSIIVLDLKQILNKSFEVKRIPAVEDLASEISEEKPDMFIISPGPRFKSSKELISAVHDQNVKVVVLSAMMEGVLSEEFRNNGIDSKFLSKPFDKKKLIEHINSCIGGKN